MVDTPILTLLCVTRAILLPLKFASASGSPQKWGNCSEMLSFKGWQISTFLLRYPGSRFNRHPALRILLGHSIQFWLQCNRTHRYTCYAIYPQVRCNSIWHSRKRLAKVSIFTPVFQLFLLIPVFHPCSKSSYSTGFSRTYAILIPTTNLRKIYFHRSALLERVLSPDSPLLLLPPQREGGMLFTAIVLWRSICPLFSILFASLRK